MKKYQVIMLAVFSLFTASCGIESSGFKDPSKARIEIVTRRGLGKGSISTVVRSIDGEYVPAGQKFVEVSPGNHEVEFDYKKIIQNSSNISFSIGFFGDEAELISPTEEVFLGSNYPLDTSGILEGGYTYYVDASEVNNENITFNRVDYILGRYDREFVKGEACLRQRRK